MQQTLPTKQVQFTTGPLGLMKSLEPRGFEPETAKAGDVGVYEGEHPTIEGWHVIRVGELLCPCHESHFEFIEESA